VIGLEKADRTLILRVEEDVNGGEDELYEEEKQN